LHAVVIYARKILSPLKEYQFKYFQSHIYEIEFLTTDPEARVRFPALPEEKKSSGSGTGSTQPREYN
jgi:hypothetical protein